MTATDIETLFSDLLKAVSEKLKGLGYAKRGQVFRVVANNNCGLIGFQRSVSNTKENISFTINLGVVCGDLLDQTITQLKSVQIVDAHVSQRIGFLLPEHQDKWWQINGSVSFESLSQEILELVSSKAVPYVSNFLNTNSIYSLWESGKSPGLTEFQRVQFLSKLKSKLNA
ncbi:MAG: DUF4304 domain-containing protein [Verrucomicrobiales bacterium]|nr:DUF4304 domain-containing protein [Verrucomicrobiales bacterium]